MGNSPTLLAVDEVLNKIYVGNTSVSNDVSANYQTWAGITVIDGATNIATPANLTGIVSGAVEFGDGRGQSHHRTRLFPDCCRISGDSRLLRTGDERSPRLCRPHWRRLDDQSQPGPEPDLLRRDRQQGSCPGRDNARRGGDTQYRQLAGNAVGTLQNWIAVNNTTGRFYVADRDNDTLWIVNGQTNAVVTSIVGLESPFAVSVNDT